MNIEPDPIEPRSEDELSVVSDVFSGADPDPTGIDTTSAPEPGAAMFYTQGGSPC